MTDLPATWARPAEAGRTRFEPGTARPRLITWPSTASARKAVRILLAALIARGHDLRSH